jgi:hypothetical protein
VQRSEKPLKHSSIEPGATERNAIQRRTAAHSKQQRKAE